MTYLITRAKELEEEEQKHKQENTIYDNNVMELWHYFRRNYLKDISKEQTITLYNQYLDFKKYPNETTQYTCAINNLNEIINSIGLNTTTEDIIREQQNEEQEEKKVEVRKPTLILPGCDNTLISDFAENLASIISNKKVIFLKTTEDMIVEIIVNEIDDKTKNYNVIFKEVTPSRFIDIIERYARTHKVTMFGTKQSSIKKSDTETLLSSQIIKDNLQKICRIFPVQIPIIHEGKLELPKKGYDERFKSYTLLTSPEIKTDMPIEQAKKVIYNIYKEFCFKKKEEKEEELNISRIMAISHLITPFIQGIMPRFNTRTPIFFYEANRERAGKDYCAAIPGIVYEGINSQDPPICTDNKNNNETSELRKKVTTMLRSGRRRFHSANNRGSIKNEVLEALATNEVWIDRLLGGNTEICLPNELTISLSANTGYTTTADMVNRCRFIRFHLDIENANERKFVNTDLHEKIFSDRSNILSAIYAVIREWFNAGMPNSSLPFASYPYWSNIVGGLMEFNGMGNPCIIDNDEFFVADSETKDMKLLFELCYDRWPQQWIHKREIMDYIVKLRNPNYVSEGDLVAVDNGVVEFFMEYNLEVNNDRNSFAKMFNKMVGRIFSDIKLVKKKASKSENDCYQFVKSNTSCIVGGEVGKVWEGLYVSI